MPSINSPTPDATTTSKGKVQLAGVLAGTAAAPTFSTATGAWGAFTPTITATTGTFTTTSGAGRFKQIGKNVSYSATITITTVGTGAGVVFTLPVTAQTSTTNTHVGAGREGAATGSAYNVTLTSATTATLFRYDNTTTVASGYVYYISGTYEAA